VWKTCFNLVFGILDRRLKVFQLVKMALSNCAAQRNGETATTHGHVLGVDLPLFKFGLLTDIQHADKVRMHRRGRT
jgi:hypothetical protein